MDGRSFAESNLDSRANGLNQYHRPKSRKRHFLPDLRDPSVHPVCGSQDLRTSLESRRVSWLICKKGMLEAPEKQGQLVCTDFNIRSRGAGMKTEVSPRQQFIDPFNAVQLNFTSVQDDAFASTKMSQPMILKSLLSQNRATVKRAMKTLHFIW